MANVRVSGELRLAGDLRARNELRMLDESEQRVVDDIARVGWHLICVAADDQGPSFVYSIGLMVTFEHPEVIIFGLNVDVMADIINTMGRDIRSGRRFIEASRYTGLVERFACKTDPLSSRFHEEYFGYGLWYRHHIGKTGTLDAIQCFWPDKAGLFPDEVGCHPAIVQLQPRLQ